ncbi:MAG: hypothetical protein AB7P03_08500 [Kofleriaceae bacterium]
MAVGPMEFLAILEGAGVTPSECAVLWQVRNTAVMSRGMTGVWASAHARSALPVHPTVEDCIRATDALISRGLLIELTADDIQADLVRWNSEPLPLSWGVDRERCPGDVDFTEAGFQRIESIMRQLYPRIDRSPLSGCNDDERDAIRVFGETQESCREELNRIVARIDQPPWGWARSALRIDPMQASGPWWYSRFERVDAGFQTVIRRGGAGDTAAAVMPRAPRDELDV